MAASPASFFSRDVALETVDEEAVSRGFSTSRRCPPRLRGGYVAVSSIGDGADVFGNMTDAETSTSMQDFPSWRWVNRIAFAGFSVAVFCVLGISIWWGSSQRRQLSAFRDDNRLLMRTEIAPQFTRITKGSCSDQGMLPINDQTVCEAAARSLGIVDTQAAATTLANRPEGCYYFDNQGQPDFDSHVDGLWMGINPESRGRGADASNALEHAYRYPICTTQAQCGSVESDIEYVGEHYTFIDNIPSADVCCEKCQADLNCGAWTWVENKRSPDAWRCSLKAPRQDYSPPRHVRRQGFISGLPSRKSKGGSLYCLALMQPQGYELGLLQLQYREHQSIFACDEYALYSNMEVNVSHGLTTSIIGSDLKCKYGGDSGTALNTGIFIALWKKVLEDGRFRFHAWTVKVDPDAVFFPDRLRGVLHRHKEGPSGVYINNCKYGLHGPVEVFSRKAMEAYALNYLQCERTFWFAFTHWGEDMYMDQCLQKVLKVDRVDEFALICEDHCDCPEYTGCKTGAITFHPFKSVDSYRKCLVSAGAVLEQQL